MEGARLWQLISQSFFIVSTNVWYRWKGLFKYFFMRPITQKVQEVPRDSFWDVGSHIMLLPVCALFPWTQNTRKKLRKFQHCYGNQRQSVIWVLLKRVRFLSNYHTESLAEWQAYQQGLYRTFVTSLFWNFASLIFNDFFSDFFINFWPKIGEKCEPPKKAIHKRINETKFPKIGVIKVWYRYCPPAHH